MKSHFSSKSPARFFGGFTLAELLVTIVIIAVLATLAFTGSDWVMKSARTSRTLDGMRQLAAGTVLYAQDHNDQIPCGDEGADGAGVGGRGIIWINHIASNVGYPELDPSADPPVLLNKSNGGREAARGGPSAKHYLRTLGLGPESICFGLIETP